VVILLAAVWIRGTSRANLIGSRSMDRLLAWFPFLGAMLRSFRVAAFTDVLALLASHDVPLDEAVVLAAESVGDRRMIETSRDVAKAIGLGERFSLRSTGKSPFPPFLDWLIQSGQQRGALLPALRHASDSYYRRAFRQASAARTLLPTLMVATVGGGVTLVYALMLFGPWVTLLHSLGKL
jgi:general secretion pathway protein F